MTYDAIIIGAGMSGLAAGIRLAQYDRRVIVVERHNLWGGLNSFYTLGGRRFDVGLHALTNYAPPGTKGVPLTRVLRQLRLKHEDLRLGEQRCSEILLPDLRMTFTNDFEHFRAEVARAFPTEVPGFERLVQAVRDYAIGQDRPADQSARKVLPEFLGDPLLREALLVPITYYCSAREDDCDWHSFVILFRSMFLEGLSRPDGGVRTLLNLLIKRFKQVQGELCMGNGVRRILVDGGAARGVELEDGTLLEAELVLSSAGLTETMQLCGRQDLVRPADVGRITFVESISILDRLPEECGHVAATSFFSTGVPLRYRPPSDGLVDVASGVISSPNNFVSDQPPEEGCMRLTFLADHDRWCALEEDAYREAKAREVERAIATAAQLTFDWRPYTVFQDIFTPRTIRHYTGHVNGAVYGSPHKRHDGSTQVDGVFLCGTDQGYLGVIGALVSGISMANRYALVSA